MFQNITLNYCCFNVSIKTTNFEIKLQFSEEMTLFANHLICTKDFYLRPAARRCRSANVRPCVCLDRTQVLCRVRYQYRGHLSRPKSLVGIFRQVTTLKSDRIVRFAQKTPKKIFPTKKQTENCVCSLSNLIISQ